jgi:ABC-type Fe3+/spermidine/putrescine transport system ATPase subunit
VLRVENLNLELGGYSILNDISFNVENGEILAIIGSSGSGKSSILKSIAGIYKTPDAVVTLNGESIGQLPIESRHTTLVFQDFVLFPHMTIRENMLIACSKQSQNELILRKLFVNEHCDKFPNQLSGGEQQRVALARAIAYKPQLLLLDEPFSNVDALTTDIIRKPTKDLIKKYGLTTIMVTHDVVDVWEMADKVLVIDSGEVVGYGIPQELYDKPSNVFVAEKLGRVIEFDGHFYRPENIYVSPNPNDFKIMGILSKVLPYGMYNIVTVKTNNQEVDLMDFTKTLVVGQKVSLQLKKEIGVNND